MVRRRGRVVRRLGKVVRRVRELRLVLWEVGRRTWGMVRRLGPASMPSSWEVVGLLIVGAFLRVLGRCAQDLLLRVRGPLREAFVTCSLRSVALLRIVVGIL